MFYVADGDSTLLSYETAIDLKILNEVNSVEEVIYKNLRDISQGIGTCKGGVVKQHIDECVKPTTQLHRRIPSHIRTKVKNIRGVTNPADYMSRHPTDVQLQSHEEIDAGEYVNFLAFESISKTVILHAIVDAKSTDTALQACHYCCTNWPLA